MRLPRPLLPTIAFLFLLTNSPCQAGLIDSAVMALGAPTVAGDTVSYGVNLNFTGDATSRLVYFGIDVSPSSAVLTAGNVPPTPAFAFEKSSPLLDVWTEISSFGNVTTPNLVEITDLTGTAGLIPGSYFLGTLKVTLPGVTPDPSLTVSIEGTATQIGAEGVQPPPFFTLFPVTFDPGEQPAGAAAPTAAPEPSSLVLALVGGGLSWTAYRRRGRRRVGAET